MNRLNIAVDINLTPIDVLCAEPERDIHDEAAIDTTLHAEWLATLEHRAAFMRRAAALRAARLARRG